MRSARSQGVADLPIGAHRGLRHHRGIAKEYCPSSSAGARHVGTVRYRSVSTLCKAPTLQRPQSLARGSCWTWRRMAEPQ
jgi:hypothetical protein